MNYKEMSAPQMKEALGIMERNIKWTIGDVKQSIERIINSSSGLDDKVRRLRRLRTRTLCYIMAFDNAGVFHKEVQELNNLAEIMYNKAIEIQGGNF